MECGFLGTSCPSATNFIRNKCFYQIPCKHAEIFTDELEKKMDPPICQEIKHWEMI
jgi:hypothetical protein